MKYAIGIDLGGTSIKYAIVSEEGKFLTEGIEPTYADVSADKIISQLFVVVDAALAYAKENNITLSGIGIGSPGIVDEAEGTILGGAENLAGWENIPLASIIEKYAQLPVKVNNDANVMGLAEAAFGAAKGCSDVLFLTIGTGIGGAILINKKLFGGFKNRGTELGHVPIIANGELCACGSVGCLEHYASASAMVRRYEERLKKTSKEVPASISGKYIIGLYHENDELAREVVDENCDFIGHGIGGFVNIFSPEKVVIGGGLADAGEFYIEKIRKAARKYAMPDCMINTTITKAELGNRAGCLGAADLILNI